MDKLAIVIIMAMQVEAIWETLKMIWQEGKFQIDKLGALCVGILIAAGAGLELNRLLGITMRWGYLDVVLTGVLISRGSNFMHDFLSKLSK